LVLAVAVPVVTVPASWAVVVVAVGAMQNRLSPMLQALLVRLRSREVRWARVERILAGDLRLEFREDSPVSAAP
jgi:hypothetical protein